MKDIFFTLPQISCIFIKTNAMPRSGTNTIQIAQQSRKGLFEYAFPFETGIET